MFISLIKYSKNNNKKTIDYVTFTPAINDFNIAFRWYNICINIRIISVYF